MPTNREYFLADMVIAACNARGIFQIQKYFYNQGNVDSVNNITIFQSMFHVNILYIQFIQRMHENTNHQIKW